MKRLPNKKNSNFPSANVQIKLLALRNSQYTFSDLIDIQEILINFLPKYCKLLGTETVFNTMLAKVKKPGLRHFYRLPRLNNYYDCVSIYSRLIVFNIDI